MGKGSVVSRFIFYSGLAHCIAFVGIVTYIGTRPKESLPEFLQSDSTPKVEREVVAMDVTGTTPIHTAANDETDPEATRELRDRKIRANLPSPPETPRVVDKVKSARKIPTQLPQKKGVSRKDTDQSVPEMSKDVALDSDIAVPPVNETAETDAAEPKIENMNAAAVSEETVAGPTQDVSKDTAQETAQESTLESDAEVKEEKLQIAPFDVDELAETHLKKLKEKEEKEHNERMAKLAAEKEAAIAAVAAEKSTAENAANEAAIAAAAAAAGKADSENGTASATQAAGDVRALSELRQRPGNRKPMYDIEDRKSGRQGLVVFLAYIKSDGAPGEFQLLASSGHRSLDAKTLKAIKSWKFQPGQEGWVEIPFQWDLKGGAQEAPATLRRRVSRQ